MRIQRLVTAFFLSGFLVASAAAFEIKPGEWEIEMSGGPAGAAAPKQKMKFCITPEQAKNQGENAMSKNMPKSCKTNFSGTKSDSVSFEIACNEQGMKMETKGTVKKISDTEVVTSNTTTIEAGGQKQTQQATIRQKYVGPTCSKEAMPSAPGK